jgi:hypothetical protein
MGQLTQLLEEDDNAAIDQGVMEQGQPLKDL